MPKIHGLNSILHIWDDSGTSRDISGDLNSITLSWSRDNPDVSTLGTGTRKRIFGIRDATLNGAALWNSDDTTGIDAILQAIMTGSLNTLVKFYPGGCTTGCQFYTTCMLLSSYDVTAPINGAVTAAFAFEQASGSVSASTV